MTTQPPKIPYITGQKSLTRKQTETVIASANSYEDKILVLIGFTLGLRRDDLVRIEIPNIDLNAKTLAYFERKKGNRIRVVPLSERLFTELRMYLNEHTEPGQKYLFPARQKTAQKSKGGNIEIVECQYMSSKTAYNIFNQLCKKANVQTPIPIHAMRSTCIKLKQEEGWTIEQVAALIGDKVSTVQEHYAVPTPNELQELMKDKGGL
jgi:integrase